VASQRPACVPASSQLTCRPQDLTVSVNSGKKVLLDKIAGQITPGFYAIMGQIPVL